MTVDISTVRCWVIKSRHIGRNLDVSIQPRSGWLVSATHESNRKNSTNLFKKIDEKRRRDLREEPKEGERVDQSLSSGEGFDVSST
jgi:hypothetical protein